MRRRRWLYVLIVLVFGVTLFLAVAKVRSPQVKFDRIAVGMSEEEVSSVLGKGADVTTYWLRPLNDDEARVGITHGYKVGWYEIEVQMMDKVVESKRLRFTPPQIWLQPAPAKSTAKMPPALPPPPPPE